MPSLQRARRWILLAALGLGGCAGMMGGGVNGLEASGVVEATEIKVSAELAGRVDAVLVEEGDRVHEGDPLFRLEAEMLQMAREQAEAAHRANMAGLRHAQDGAELELISAQHALEELREGEDLARAQARQELADAKQALEDAQYLRRVRQQGNRADQDALDAAEAKLVLAEHEVDLAKANFDKHSGRDRDNPSRAMALRRLANARQERDAVLRSLNWLKGAPDEIDQAQLDAEVAKAEARVDAAERTLERMEEGPDRRQLEAATARVEAAQSQLEQIEAELVAEEAGLVLKMAELQLEKAVVSAPADGTVLTRAVDAGEMAQPGLPLIVLGQLDELRITVYLPEDRYGEVSLGDEAKVEADSFPNERFSATVIRIADQAEFTPRNVQTEEERQTTVYAVELSVEDPEGQLKPGMPADVIFSP